MNKKLLLKGGKILDIVSGYNLEIKDVLVDNGIITQISDDIVPAEGFEIVHLNGHIVAPGFIDIHTHVYTGNTSLGIDPDIIGLQTGCTTVFDAGSAGAKNFERFYKEIISKSKTRVLSLLNLASPGLEQERYELANYENIDIEALKETVTKYKGEIVGIKARASASTVGDLGIEPIKIAKQVAVEVGLPLVVHIGNAPPTIEEVLSILGQGDVITHCFHGKSNGLLDEKGLLKKETQEAIKRGVLFDVGHGTSSFSFKTAEKALKQGFIPDIISTDIYLQNYNGPVYSLVKTLEKFMALGLSLGDCIKKVTAIPAQTFGLRDLGHLKEGYKGELTIFEVNHEDVCLMDSEGNTLKGNTTIKITHVVKDSVIIDVCNRGASNGNIAKSTKEFGNRN